MRAIIPCAGRAERFNGRLKELLPISNLLCPLTNSIQLANLFFKPKDVIVISNEQKIKEHATEVSKLHYFARENVYFALQYSGNVWHSVVSQISPFESHVLLLGDTVTDIQRQIPKDADFVLGLFTTTEVHRFSIVHDDHIITKPQDNTDVICKAWGMVYWSQRVSVFFYENYFEHYDEAFNAAIDEFGLSTFDLAYYYDLGDFKSYKEYLRR